MSRVGIIVAVEFDLFRKIYGIKEIERSGCYKVFQIKDGNSHLIFLSSGPGEIQGAAATQYMIDTFQPDFLVNFGLAGGLDESINVSDICVVDGVIHTDYNVSTYSNCNDIKQNDSYCNDSGKHNIHCNDIKQNNSHCNDCGIKPGQYPGLSSEKIRMDRRLVNAFYRYLEKLRREGGVSMVSCASQDRIIMGDDMRRALGRKWNCQICDMELAGICLVALKNRVPLVSVKVVSDTVGDDCDAMDNWQDKFYEDFAVFVALLRSCENLDKY